MPFFSIIFEFMCFFLVHACRSFSEYQFLIDQTKQSINARKLEENIYDLNNSVYYPGDYYENKIMFSVKVPTITIHSPIIKGLAFSDQMFGFIPKNTNDFDNISQHFAIINPETKQFFDAKLVEFSQDVYLYSMKLKGLTDIFNIKWFEPTVSLDVFKDEFSGIEVSFEARHDMSTHENVYSFKLSFCYDTPKESDDDKFSLNRILSNKWSEKYELENWKFIVALLLLGGYHEITIRHSGVLEGSISINLGLIAGSGIGITLGDTRKTIEELLNVDLIQLPYIPYLKLLGIVLDFSLDLRAGFFLKEITFYLPVIKCLTGFQGNFGFSVDYSVIPSFAGLKNWRITQQLNAKPVYYLESFSSFNENIGVEGKVGFEIKPLYLHVDIPGIKAEVEFAVDIYLNLKLNLNTNCTKLIQYTADFGVDFVGNISCKFVLLPEFKTGFKLEIYRTKDAIKKCITDYTQEAKNAQREEADPSDYHQSDPTIPVPGPDPTPIPTPIPVQIFHHSLAIDGKTATLQFDDESVNHGLLYLYEDKFTMWNNCYYVAEVENALLPSATQIGNELLFLIPSMAAYPEEPKYNSYYVANITFERRKKLPVKFKFFDAFQFSQESFYCQNHLLNPGGSLLDFACIGSTNQISLMECCNDCSFKYCQSPMETMKLSNNYKLYYSPLDVFLTLGHKYLDPAYVIMPENTETLFLPKDSFTYEVHVKCSRCKSIQFIDEENQQIINSQYDSKTDSFIPLLPKTSGIFNERAGFNESIRIIAFCNSNYDSNCYFKCPQIHGYGVVQLDDANGVHIYSGDLNKIVSDNAFEKNVQYQVISNYAPEDYCMKTWKGSINIVEENINKGPLTISIVEKDDDTVEIKAFQDWLYIPFSKSKMMEDIEKFFTELGLDLSESHEYKLLGTMLTNEEDQNIAELTQEGSVKIKKNYFKEENVRVEESFDIPPAFIETQSITHEEIPFNPYYKSSISNEKAKLSSNPDNKTKLSGGAIAAIVISIIIVLGAISVIIVIYLKKKKIGDENCNNKEENCNNEEDKGNEVTNL